jgi:hypothetical protein
VLLLLLQWSLLKELWAHLRRDHPVGRLWPLLA